MGKGKLIAMKLVSCLSESDGIISWQVMIYAPFALFNLPNLNYTCFVMKYHKISSYHLGSLNRDNNPHSSSSTLNATIQMSSNVMKCLSILHGDIWWHVMMWSIWFRQVACNWVEQKGDGNLMARWSKHRQYRSCSIIREPRREHRKGRHYLAITLPTPFSERNFHESVNCRTLYILITVKYLREMLTSYWTLANMVIPNIVVTA